ncbi:uncharacterized protein PRCAT00000003001 [Priceomyces carsonii]|uniref:uncharacterized protein n=1 Tax=Priceomyces carsonii TaxID=28549 RepID=UPI002ED89B0B|nr:unnamed protein product [Priceomyces carsonii]
MPTIKIIWSIKYLSNISWYKDILEELNSYANDELLTIEVYITRDKNEGRSMHTVDRKIDKENQEKEVVELLEGKVESSTIQLSTCSSSCARSPSVLSPFFDMTNIDVYFGRVDLSMALEDQSRIYESESQRKSLAVIGCGSRSFVDSIKYSCQTNRWKKNSPDIYCTTESY